MVLALLVDTAAMPRPTSSQQFGGPESDFVIVEWSDPGLSESDWIAPLHVHYADDEAWYVLEGALRFRVGEETFDVGAGGGVLAPKGTPHAYGNARRGQMARVPACHDAQDPCPDPSFARTRSRGLRSHLPRPRF